MTEKNLKLSEVVDYINELEGRLDNFNIYSEELEDRLDNAERIIDYIDGIISKTGSLEEIEWEKVKNKYRKIEMLNSIIRTLNTVVEELWDEDNTISDCIKQICLETVEDFQNCLDLLNEKSIEFDK